MRRVYKISACLLFFALLYTLCISVEAHPGGTDGSGGHTNHSTGEYHYHHGYPAHNHYDIDGDGTINCPYDFDDKTENDSRNNSIKSENSQVNDTSKATHITFSTNASKVFLALLGVLFCFPIAEFLHYPLSNAIDHLFKSRTIPEKFYDVLLYFIWASISVFLIYLIIIL